MQVHAFRRQRVFHRNRNGREYFAFKNALFFQMAERRGQRPRADIRDFPLQLAKTLRAAKELADDEKCPFSA